MVDDLVAASRILANEGVLDCFGHVSARSPNNPSRYLLSRNLVPELVTAADIVEFEVESSNPVEPRDRPLFLERFIHGGIYKARPDINAIVHSHSPSVIPFSIVSSVPMRPVYHMSGFLHAGVPIYEIRNDAGMSDMLIRSVELGSAVARALGEKPVALLRGHGNVVVGPTIPIAVYRAIYTEINSRLQMQALTLGGRVEYLAPEEGKQIDAVVPTQVSRPWELWKKRRPLSEKFLPLPRALPNNWLDPIVSPLALLAGFVWSALALAFFSAVCCPIMQRLDWCREDLPRHVQHPASA